jgi:hypothetical protein
MCHSVSRGRLGLLCPGLAVVSVCHRVNVYLVHFTNCLSLSDTCQLRVVVLGEGNRNGNKTSLILSLSDLTIICVEKF